LPDRVTITGTGFDIETSHGPHQGGQGNTGLTCVLADGLVSLRSPGQEVMEKRPGTSIEFVAPVDILVSGHQYVPFREPSGLCGPEYFTEEGWRLWYTRVPFQCRLYVNSPVVAITVTGCMDAHNRSEGLVAMQTGRDMRS